MNAATATFGLAPMEGVSDWAFRLWFSLTGPTAFMSTPFLRATDTYPKSIPVDFAPEISRLPAPYGLIPQVMASRPEDFVRAARFWLDEGAEFVDLNCGCPSPNPVSGGAGSSLLKTRATFLEFIDTIAKELPAKSFSVKMRTGFDDTDLFYEIIEGLRDAPLRQLTVHGRTRKDRYDGEARWDLIDHARRELSFPVVASGDIVSSDDWQTRSAKFPEISRAIIGRGALRNPWIFTELSTGKAVRMSRQTLILSLAIFGRIMDLSYREPSGLEARVRDRLFENACGVDEKSWSSLWSALGGGDLFSQVTERFAFGRTKMIWNSLRSSLPEEFFAPTLLRSKNLGEFLSALDKLGPEEFTVTHNKNLDWLYTSSKKAAISNT
ncbi:MAG: tRNA-dihydrouridine synthase family protein [Bdellovibrionota bacterium]